MSLNRGTITYIGEYQKGSDKEADFALEHIELVNNFLKQSLDEKSNFTQTIDYFYYGLWISLFKITFFI